jgi:type II secretory pathway predicted ATPase ExeA
MFKAYYGFNKIPFAKDIKTSDIFWHENLKEIASRLDYMKKYKGVLLITGAAGTGKTTAVRQFVDSLNPDVFHCAYIPLSTVAISDFYKQLNDKLKGEKLGAKSLLFKSIQERIIHYTTQKNKTPVIIIDEAHLLKNENFFELQIIMNFNMDSIDPALFILIAQSHLNDRLSRTILESFNQRINMKYHFKRLSLVETKELILDNFKKSGVETQIFNENAYQSIHNLSNGILRNIGKLVIKSLTLGALTKKQILTEKEVFEVSKEI